MVVNTDVEVRYESTLNQHGADNLDDACKAASERSEMLMKLGFETQLGFEVVTVCWGGGWMCGFECVCICTHVCMCACLYMCSCVCTMVRENGLKGYGSLLVFLPGQISEQSIPLTDYQVLLTSCIFYRQHHSNLPRHHLSTQPQEEGIAQDGKCSFTLQPEEEGGSTVPFWAWIVVGIGALFLCCCCCCWGFGIPLYK